jgi:hypothetical protein
VLELEVDQGSEHVPAGSWAWGGFGCLRRLAVLLGLFWVLGNGSVWSATRAGNQML